ncbi:type II secretion system GspH family protein [Massilia sp. MB5]|uniref:type II secretion system protein n=1 Tax=unclassified Massilia TaxID=2609279 RepID=UPI00067CC124|nr:MULTISPECIES: type II secretion system protein [unclassified Massilia]AKU21521.1 type II secretion system protein G [Massilia sp. NR 4-1]UMR28895.1 type II secretion system GspH family protein [Massilia sp. MB5]
MRRARGFTILELLVVMAIIGTLLSLAAPRYFRSMEKTKESVLRENLNVIRSTLDRYYSDMGVYPETLQELVDRRYLRKIPDDPLTGSDSSWSIVPAASREQGVVADVRSGSSARSSDGSAYRDW